MKKSYVKLIAMLLAVLSCVSALSACNGAANTPSDTEADASSDAASSTTAPSKDKEPQVNADGYTIISNGLPGVGKYYANPITGYAPDPMIIEHNGTYYLYSTGGGALHVRTSKNLIAWSNSKLIFELSQTNWGIDCCWAPEVHEYNGKFYLFFCGKDSSGIFHGSVAVCDTPDGTFQPITETPLLNFDYSVIDLSFFRDGDGKTYIFYSKDCSTNIVDGKNVSQSYGVQVSNDFTSLIGEPVLCTTPELDWETKSGGTLWNEGPLVFKHNNKYYLLYSANLYSSPDYAVGYAVADSVLGPYTKPESNCIMKGNGDTIAGPGHCNILRVGGDTYLVYHAWTDPNDFSKDRSLYMSKLVIKEDGSLHVNGPSKERYPLPDGINGTLKYCDEIKIDSSIADTKQDAAVLTDGIISRGMTGVTDFANGDSVTFTLEASEIDAIWVYGANIYGNEAKTVDIIINDTYILEGVKFSSERGGVAIAVLSKLPKGTLVEKITLTNFTGPKTNPVSITEVEFVSF